MKTTKIFLMLATASLLSAGCSDNETTDGNIQGQQEPLQGTTFVGGIAPNTGAKPTTRTSLNVILPGGTTVDYFWEKGDKIWTADNTNGEAQITTTSPTAKFQMGKDYVTPTVALYYPGKSATAYNAVTISTHQTQTAPNNTQHLGEAGDCGTATAHQQPDGTYHFNLDHKAAYLCLLPRTLNKLVSTYISQIKITADNNIAGTYTLSSAGLTGSGSSKEITVTTKSTGGTYANGFPLNNATTSQSTNAIYAVIAPGTHTLTIEYTIKDVVTNVGGTITKTVASAAYDANTVYPLTANINPKDYSDMKYYMWDAAVGQDYWKDYESDQPKLNGDSNSNYPKSGDPRYYRENSELSDAKLSCKDCFRLNRLTWYMDKGKPHWDNSSCWTAAGHLYTGGLWMKKISVIATETGNTLAYLDAHSSDGVRYGGVENPGGHSVSISATGKPANSGDYFFLPAMGRYTEGKLTDRGIKGYFWTNAPWNQTHFYWTMQDAFVFDFNSTTARFYGTGAGWWAVGGNLGSGCPLGVEQ